MRETEIQAALRACRSTAAVLLVFSFALNLLVLVSPIYMMQVFDHVLGSRSIDTLVMLTLITGIAIAVLAVMDALRGQLLARVGMWLDERVGPAVLGGALHVALRHEPTKAGQSLRDLGAVKNFLSGPAIAPLLDAPWAPVFILALFALHPMLGVVGVIGGVILFGLALINEFATRKPLQSANVAVGRTHTRVESALRNAEVIRAMGMLDGVVHLWRRDSLDGRAATLAAGNRGAIVLGLSKYARLMVQILILATGAWLVIHQEASAGAMFASSFLLGRALAPVENAIGTWKTWVSARLAYRRLNELLRAAPARERGMELPRPQGELMIERVTYVPPGAEAPALRGVSCGLTPGQVLGIIGPSAAGKSTLARLIAGSWVPTAGNVRLDGADIQVWLDSGGAKHIGYLPQDIELFAGSVKDNIARLGDAEPAQVIEAASLVGLHETIMRLPRGYDSEIGEGGLKLSGGQRQRLGLARALFGRPRLVVLDEPNASLDHEGEEALVRAIAHLKAQGTTVVVIAHRPSILGQADKLLVLRQGMVDAFGDKNEVIAKLNAAAAQQIGTQRSAALAKKQTA